MPRISAATNAAQRENTKRAILDSFGQLLYQRGLTGLTMTHVAKNAGVGRTAVYNYFADIEELLIAYALEETEKFLSELRESLNRLDNPVERLALYVRAVAKGVRKTKSRFGARLEPCSHVALQLYEGRELDIVTEAQSVDQIREAIEEDALVITRR